MSNTEYLTSDNETQYVNGEEEHQRHAYPEFINISMEKYYEDRVNKSWRGKHILNGKTPTANSLIFSSNDYLNISQHPQLINAQIAAMQKYGNGQMQSAVFLNNNSFLLTQCEKKFSSFLNYSAALLTQSGWSANVGLIQTLAKYNTPVYLDFYAHMSFWSGVKAARAKPIPFRHNSIDSLKNRIEHHGPGIIAVDSIYSTLGTISPLADYAEIARKFKCLLIVDESHSLGTHGPQGKGMVAKLGLSSQIDLLTASLAKAFSGRGGLIAGDRKLIEYIRYSSLPSIFSSALMPHDLAGFSTSLEIITQEEWRRKKLQTNAEFLRKALSCLRINIGGSESQIVPLITGSEANTLWLRDELEKEEIFGAVFCSPATPKNKCLIRLSIGAHHEKSDLLRVIDCLTRLAKKRPEIPLFKNN
ncbi:TPA: quorum-sensing autoinducer synthase [Legionella pneumophila]|nr:quorum-sensing autoinducer LAI-1 synthase LqsA [Legionella pneumophila subsp. fraseri]HAT1773141.1 quorum-sensing autoinducer synthase [Legionella pneumophila]MDX1847269.1 quorum-sensing autoinducer LAI-1 synthase LqsA [Legionella pneumophila subsp. fraseri]HAT2137043.1 quorum-sensing autoinducer synthase [Legionella pneumophila]HAT2143157.1 quorum-sensing autoinducer synthase [Legionella pneumophila]